MIGNNTPRSIFPPRVGDKLIEILFFVQDDRSACCHSEPKAKNLEFCIVPGLGLSNDGSFIFRYCVSSLPQNCAVGPSRRRDHASLGLWASRPSAPSQSPPRRCCET